MSSNSDDRFEADHMSHFSSKKENPEKVIPAIMSQARDPDNAKKHK